MALTIRNQVVRALLLAACVLLVALPSVACDVPVFRYALERWSTDHYQAVVFSRGALTGEDKARLDGLRHYADTRDANCDVVAVDLDNQPSKSALLLWEAQKAPRLPWVVLRAPWDADEGDHTWAGPLADAGYLLNSPARQQVVRKVSAGDSVVWVLLESGDRRRDTAAAALLQARLPQLERTLTLPVMGDVSVRGGRPLAPVPPLKLAFSTVRVAHDDARERIFADVLRHSDPRLKGDGPVLFPVFGRGRSLVGLAGDDLTADMLQQVAEYLIGPCACIVKESNPGNDLLLAASWDALVEQGVVEDPPLPSFAEMPAPVVAARPPATTKPAAKSVAARKRAAKTGATPQKAVAPMIPVAAERASADVTPPAAPVVTAPARNLAPPAGHTEVSPTEAPLTYRELLRNALLASLAGLVLSMLVVGLLVRRVRNGR